VDIFSDRPIQQLLVLVAGLLVAIRRICRQDRERGAIVSLA